MLILTVIWAACFYAIILHFANVAYDQALEDSAQSVAEQIRLTHQEIIVDLPQEARNIINYDLVDDVFFNIVDQNGQIVYGKNTPFACPAQLSAPNSSQLCNGLLMGKEIRIVEYVLPNSDPAHPVMIRVAETMNKRIQLAKEVLQFTLLPQALFITALAILIWLGIGKGMLPVRRIRDAIAARTHEDLSPLDHNGMPAELYEQVKVINDLMARLQKTIDTQKRFIADAAHQIRTPITVISAQSELAARLEDPEQLKTEIVRIQQSATRLVRLSNQLLKLNRAESVELHSINSEEVDISDLLEDVVAEMVPFALEKDIEISLFNHTESITIVGDKISLGEMLVNLIDNAIRYSPHKSRIQIRSHLDGKWVILSVIDSGPGIPESELEKALERFYRCTNITSDGSGLGLAIAREIALIHHGMIKLSTATEGWGLKAEIYLPNAKSLLAPLITSL